MVAAIEQLPYIPGLTLVETRIMHTLQQAEGRVVSTKEMMREVYGLELRGCALNVHIRRIRQKLGRDAITTIRGRGHVLGKAHCCDACGGSGYVIE